MVATLEGSKTRVRLRREALLEEDEQLKRAASRQRQERIHRAVDRTADLLSQGTARDDPRLRKWRTDDVETVDAETAKSNVMRDLGLVASLPLSMATFGELAGYKDVPRQPEVAAVKPPWNYEPKEGAYAKRRPSGQRPAQPEQQGSSPLSRANGILAAKESPEEVKFTRDLKKQIDHLDKKLGKIEALEKGSHLQPRKPRQSAPPSASKQRAPQNPQGQSRLNPQRAPSALRFKPAPPTEPRDRRPQGEEQSLRAHVNQINSRMKELMANSNAVCAREIKAIFRALLQEELDIINGASQMRKDTKQRLAKTVKAVVMRRVDLEMQKRKLFEWPEDGVKKYAEDSLREEREMRVEERRRTQAALRREKSKRSFRMAAQAAIATSQQKHKAAASVVRRSLGRANTLLDRMSPGKAPHSRGSIGSRSSLRPPGTPLGLVLGDKDRDAIPSSSLRRVTEIGFKGSEEEAELVEETEEAVEAVTDRVIKMLSGDEPADQAFLQSITRLRLNGELMGRLYTSALVKILPLCRELRVLELPRNDLGASSFHGLMDAMYRAPCLPLRELDLSVNCLGADGGASVAPLTVYLGKISRPPGAPGHNIQRLNLRACMLGDAGLHTFAAALPTMSTLRELDLSENVIGDLGIRALSRALCKGANQSLVWLKLAYNDIGAMGAHELGVVLESGSQLQHLILAWNRGIGPRGLDRLAQSLQENQILEELNLEACELDDSCIDTIALLSLINTVLAVLHIESNNFTLHGKRRLWQLLAQQEGKSQPGATSQVLQIRENGGVSLTTEELRQRIEANQSAYATPGASPRTKGSSANNTPRKYGTQRRASTTHLPALF